MKKVFLYNLFFLTPLLAFSQRTDVNFVLGGGTSQIFNSNPQASHYYNDLDPIVGVNVCFNKKNRAMIFNPGITILNNEYNYKMDQNEFVKIKQTMIGLSLDVLMKIGRKNYFRTGILINSVYWSNVFVSIHNFGNYYYGYSNDQLYENYSPAQIQANVIAGLVLPFTILRRNYKFDVTVTQNLSGVVNYDYLLDYYLSTEKVKALSVKARPTKLSISLEVNLRKKKKPKTEEEE